MKAGKIVGGILFGIPGILVGSLVDNMVDENKTVKQENTHLKSELSYHEETLRMANMTKEEVRYQVADVAPYVAAILANIHIKNNFNIYCSEVWLNALQSVLPGYKGITNLAEFREKANYFNGNSMYRPRTSAFDTPSKKREIILFLDNLVSACNRQAEIFVNKQSAPHDAYYANILIGELNILENEIKIISKLYE